MFRKTVRKQGLKGLYQGCESQLLKGFLSEGVKLVVKDRCVSRSLLPVEQSRAKS